MSVAPKNPYEILGVHPSATDDQIRRAFRRNVITSHREGVFEIIDRIRDLRRAYARVRDPEARRGQSGLEEPSVLSSDRDETTLREGGVRVSMRREIGHLASRLGAEALAENAVPVRRLGHEHERRERLAREQRAREARLRKALQLALVVLVIAAAWLTIRR